MAQAKPGGPVPDCKPLASAIRCLFPSFMLVCEHIWILKKEEHLVVVWLLFYNCKATMDYQQQRSTHSEEREKSVGPVSGGSSGMR